MEKGETDAETRTTFSDGKRVRKTWRRETLDLAGRRGGRGKEDKGIRRQIMEEEQNEEKENRIVNGIINRAPQDKEYIEAAWRRSFTLIRDDFQRFRNSLECT